MFRIEGWFGRQRQRPLVERDGVAITALLGEHGAARGDHAPVRVGRIVGRFEQPLGKAHLVEFQRQPAVFAVEAAMAGIEVGSLLQHRQRLALLAYGLEVAGVGERFVGVARFLGEFLAQTYP